MLDIIIPVYNNQQGLTETLQSINPAIMKDITITIIDDCSSVQYDVKTIRMPQNGGPGAARQYGINHTIEPFIMFVDAGDTFVDFDSQLEMIETIKHTDALFISFLHNTIKEDGTIRLEKHTNNRLHGKVYRRSFLNQYHITFCQGKIGSYANEDIGFNFICHHILEDKNLENKFICIDVPLINWTYDEQSLTHINNNAYGFVKQVPGLIENTQHIVEVLEDNDCNAEIIAKILYNMLGRLYTDFVNVAAFCPERIDITWKQCRTYYLNDVLPYKEYRDTNLNNIYIGGFMYRVMTWKKKVPINYNRFLQELENCEKAPKRYFEFYQL